MTPLAILSHGLIHAGERVDDILIEFACAHTGFGFFFAPDYRAGRWWLGLLDDMCQFMRKQTPSLRCVGGVPACTENDVIPGGVGEGLHGIARAMCCRVAVYPDMAEVMSKASFHLVADIAL